MIHYAQSLLLTHLAEAAPWPIPMTPWWVVTFLWCQLHGQLIGTGLHVRTSSFLAVITRVEFWWCCPCFVAAIFWWNIQLEVPPRVEFTPHPQAGNTTGCGPNGVVFPYFLARKYHPGGILAITAIFLRSVPGGGCQPEENVTGLRKGDHSSADIYSIFF
jgi:hypothetical protein